MAKGKGIHPLVWVLGGCGIVVVMAVFAVIGLGWFAGTKVKGLVEDIAENPVTMGGRAVALANPEIDFVSADETNRTITFRRIEDGAEFTVDFEDVENGNISFSGPEGENNISFGDQGLSVTNEEGETTARFGAGGADNLPGWAPRPDGVELETSFTANANGKATGTYAVPGDSVETLISFFTSEMEQGGFTVENQRVSAGEYVMHTLQGKNDAADREMTVMISDQEGQARAVVTYSGAE